MKKAIFKIKTDDFSHSPIFSLKCHLILKDKQEKPMQINPDYNTAAYTIRSYEAGEIVIFEPISSDHSEITNTEPENNRQRANATLLILRNSFIITPEKLIKEWEVENPHLLTKDHFQTIANLKPELVILGTGEKIHFPAAEDYLFLQQQGIGVEVMDTAAACRTYNFLVADGRNVAAGLFMI